MSRRGKALIMQPFETQVEKEVVNWRFAMEGISFKENLSYGQSFKDSQFKPH